MDCTGQIPQLHNGFAWYALYCQVNHEREVVKRLEQKAVSCFLPLMETWSKRQDRRKKIQLPMFPGYVFVRIALPERMRVLRVPGLVSLVGFGWPHGAAGLRRGSSPK